MSSWGVKLITSFRVTPPRMLQSLYTQTWLSFAQEHYLVFSWYIVSVSLFPQSDCQMHLLPQVTTPHIEEYVSSIHLHQPASSQLNKFRMYLSVAQVLDYSISAEMTKVRHSAINSVCAETPVLCRPVNCILDGQPLI